jgi:catechol-2,3-dioxygenase
VSANVIAAIGHAALRVRDLGAAVTVATEVMGLRETERSGEWVYLTHGTPHHSLQLTAADVDAVDHIGLVAASPDALGEIRERLEREGVRLLHDGPLDGMLEDGITFVGPDGFVFEVYTGMPAGEPEYVPHGVRPRRFGHFNIYLPDPQPMWEFLQRVLDFRVSDRVGPAGFLRCNADHHGIGLAPADSARLHHYAWEVESIADLGRLGDVLAARGHNLVWGPVRHGAGNNIAAYFVDAADLVVEFYTDMVRIEDEGTYVPGTWDRDDPRFLSLWWQAVPQGLREHGLPPAPLEPR